MPLTFPPRRERTGIWLIDPYNIEIVSSGFNSIFDTGTAGDEAWQPTDDNAQIDVGTILDGLLTGDVLITTTGYDNYNPALPEGGVTAGASVDISPDVGGQAGNIDWNADLDLNGTGGSTGSLTLLAHNDINIRGSIEDSDVITVDDRIDNLTLVADQDGNGSGGITIQSEDSSAANLNIGVSGTLSMKGNGITIQGGLTADGRQVNVLADTINIDAGTGNIDVIAGSDGHSVSVQSQNLNIGAMSFDGSTSVLGPVDTTQAGANNMTVQGSDDNSGNSSGAFAGIYSDSLKVKLDGDLTIKSGTGSISSAFLESYGTDNTIDILGDLNLTNTHATIDNNSAGLAYGTGVVNVGDTINLEGGEIVGYGAITTQQLDWQSGRIAGDGTLTSTGSESSISTDGEKKMVGRVWEQEGEVDWQGGDVNLVATTLNNSGSFTAQSNNSIVYDDSDDGSSEDTTPFINNSGTFTKAGGGGTTLIEPTFTNTGMVNANSGVLDFLETYTQNAGQTDLNGGDLLGHNEFDFHGGSLIGSGDVTGNVNVGAATIAPGHSSGTININGNLIASAATTFDFELGGENAGEIDVLNVSGDATLAGTMNIGFIDGYDPVLSGTEDTFNLINVEGNASGGFTTENTGSVAANVTTSTTQTTSLYNVTYELDELPPTIPPASNPNPPIPDPTPSAPQPQPEQPLFELPPLPDLTDILLVVFGQVPEWLSQPPRRDIKMCMADDTSY